MDAQRAAAALNQDIEIPARLCRLYYAKTVRVAGNLDVIRIAARNLQEYSCLLYTSDAADDLRV